MRRRRRRAISVEAFLRARRRRRWVVSAVLLSVLLLLVVMDQGGWLLYRSDAYGPGSPRQQRAADLRAYHGKWFVVTSVISGDTLEIDAPDGTREVTRVRLRGVEAPHMQAVDAQGNTIEPMPWAAESAKALADLSQGSRVRLVLDRHTTREWGGHRVLAQVELENGTVLAEPLLAAGLLQADRRWEHELSERFRLIERQARQEGRGVWSGDR